HFSAERRVARENAEISEQVEAWRGHRGNEPDHEVIRLEQDRARAVTPRMLEAELEPAVGEALEPFLSDRRPRDVTAQPLELPAIAPIDRLLCMNVDAAVVGDGLVWLELGSFGGGAGAEDEPELGLSRSLCAHAEALRCGGVAGGKARLVEQELGDGLVAFGLEAPAALSEQRVHALRGAACDVEHSRPTSMWHGAQRRRSSATAR